MCVFAMLFPGQGSQYINMLSSFFKQKNNIFKNTFHEASDYININLLKLIKEGPINKLNQSQYTQSAILTSSIAIYRFWKHCNGKDPLYMAGHSLGEYSALVCSQSIKFSDALKIVFLRGKWMEEITAKKLFKTKAIIGLNQKIVEKICLKFINEMVSIASINSDNQIIISGTKSSVNKITKYCKKKGAKHTLDLNIQIPVHNILMKPISIKLNKILNSIQINTPKIPIINNINVKCETNSFYIKQALIKQIYSTVRWNEIINLIKFKKIFLMLEIGPNKILTNLNKNKKNIHTLSTNNLKNFSIAFNTINNHYEY